MGAHLCMGQRSEAFNYLKNSGLVECQHPFTNEIKSTNTFSVSSARSWRPRSGCRAIAGIKRQLAVSTLQCALNIYIFNYSTALNCIHANFHWLLWFCFDPISDISCARLRSAASGGRTPLHVAAERGFADVAEVKLTVACFYAQVGRYYSINFLHVRSCTVSKLNVVYSVYD